MPFEPGRSGNPAGGPVGSRHRQQLNSEFLAALLRDFRQGGPKAIERVRRTQPAAYLKILALMMPREHKIEHRNPVKDPAVRVSGRITGWTKRVAEARQSSGVDFRLHDLRRTARTLMSRLGVAEDLAELAIGHVRADLVARYNKDQAWEGRRDAFTRVSDHVAALIGAREGAAVIPLRG